MAVQQAYPFNPRGLETNPPTGQSSGAVLTTVTQIALAGTPVAQETTLRLVVDGTAPISFCFGVAAGLTYANGMVLLPNTTTDFNLPEEVTQLSVIAAATGSTLRCYLGIGT